MQRYRPERILVHERSWEDEVTSEVLDRLPGIPVATIRAVEDAFPEILKSSDPQTSGKRTLILTRHLGRFMKDCPGAGAEICCNYYVVNYASNCHMECSYCVLQSYLNNPTLEIFTNLGDLETEIARRVRSAPHQAFRIGTGEIADSLALDPITRYSRRLVPLFGLLPNALLELKTKSDCIENLEGLDHQGRTVVSWSMNSERITREEELKTASFEQRIASAKRCQEWGYRVGFHFDPLVHYEGWEEDYRSAVKILMDSLDRSKIAWVSLGSLRFTPNLREVIMRRFPKSKIPYGEFVPGNHSKWRYFRPIREDMYRKMSAWLNEAAPGLQVFLCMENRAAWESSTLTVPADTDHLSRNLDALVQLSL